VTRWPARNTPQQGTASVLSKMRSPVLPTRPPRGITHFAFDPTQGARVPLAFAKVA
jgi:hypothetical protein